MFVISPLLVFQVFISLCYGQDVTPAKKNIPVRHRSGVVHLSTGVDYGSVAPRDLATGETPSIITKDDPLPQVFHGVLVAPDHSEDVLEISTSFPDSSSAVPEFTTTEISSSQFDLTTVAIQVPENNSLIEDPKTEMNAIPRTEFQASDVSPAAALVPVPENILDSTVTASSTSKPKKSSKFDEIDSAFVPESNLLDYLSSPTTSKPFFDGFLDLSDVQLPISRNSRIEPKSSPIVPTSDNEEKPFQAANINQTGIPDKDLHKLRLETAASKALDSLIDSTSTASALMDSSKSLSSSSTTTESLVQSTVFDDVTPTEGTTKTISTLSNFSTTIEFDTTETPSPSTRKFLQHDLRSSNKQSKTYGNSGVSFFQESPTLRFFQENSGIIVGCILGTALLVLVVYVTVYQWKRYRSGRLTVCRATIDWKVSDQDLKHKPLLFTPSAESPLVVVETTPPNTASPECVIQPRRLTTFTPSPSLLPKSQ